MTACDRTSAARRKRILAVASGGGHWVELMRLRSAFEPAEIVYVTVQKGYGTDVPGHRFHVVPDATRWNRLAVLMTAIRLTLIMFREKPDVVVTTGAAHGYLAMRIGKWFGARTVWIDSIANAEELSLSGRMAGRYADLWLTQWPHLAREDGPHFAGSVL